MQLNQKARAYEAKSNNAKTKINRDRRHRMLSYGIPTRPWQTETAPVISSNMGASQRTPASPSQHRHSHQSATTHGVQSTASAKPNTALAAAARIPSGMIGQPRNRDAQIGGTQARCGRWRGEASRPGDRQRVVTPPVWSTPGNPPTQGRVPSD